MPTIEFIASVGWLVMGITVVASACTTEPGPPEVQSAELAAPPRDAAAIQRGRQIYMTGKSPSGGKIEAVLAGEVVANAATLPCVGCHGEDGRGRPEGGMAPSTITWEQLGKPYGGRGRDGREHAPYTPDRLGKAIAMGIDPSGNQLLATMPRHRMSLADMDSLVAYLETLGEHDVIGIDEQVITLATILPTLAPLPESAETSSAAEAVLLAYFAEINARGGVFGRRLELEVIRLPRDLGPTRQVELLAAAWVERPSFAVLAPQLGAAEPELLRWLADAGVPVIGPVSSYPSPGTPPMASVFWVDGGIPAQARTLAEFALKPDAPGRRRGVVVFPDRPPERALAEAVLAIWKPGLIESPGRGPGLIESPGRAPGLIEGLAVAVAIGEDPSSADSLAAELLESKPDIVLYLGPAELGLAALTGFANADSRAEPAQILLPGSLAIGDPFSLPDRLDGRIFAAYPWLPDDLDPAALRDYQTLADRHDLPATGRPTQLATLTSAKLLLEGLMRAGRSVTRPTLVSTLDSLREFETGLTPALSFSPNQHIGLHAPRIVRFDLAATRLDVVDLDPE